MSAESATKLAKAEVERLREQLHKKRAALRDTDVATYAQSQGTKQVDINNNSFKCCRNLQGHTGKIYSLDWCYRETSRIVSASQDGRLIVWNAISGQKTHAFKLACAWVKTCAISPSGTAVACGGLDNVCSIYNLNSPPDRDGNLAISASLTGHSGYLSCCKYIPTREERIVTSSQDRTCRLWDVERESCVGVFGAAGAGAGDFSSGHTGDVMSVSVSPSKPNLFISGSCDRTAKLWDMRASGTSRAQRTFHGHEGDVNTVHIGTGDRHLATGSDDGSCRLFDIGTGHELQQYWDRQALARAPLHVASVACSSSGRLLFAAYSNGNCFVWDTLLAKVVANLGGGRAEGHTNRVSCLALATDGDALCTGSSDSTLKVWCYAGK